MGEFKKGFKGFESGLICKGKQYAENTVFEEPKASPCRCGMHFCENPFDVLDYYDLVNDDGSFNDFAEVESQAESLTDDNHKFCTTKLKIGAKLSFSGFVKACVDFVIEKTKFEKVECNITDNSGDSAQIGSSGYYAQIGSSGYSAKIGSSGDYAQIESTGEDSVICCAGHNSVVKAKKGNWITLAEWKRDDSKGRYVPVCVKTEFVDGENIKADTWYCLKNGGFVEAESEE